jgi:hypothetical protein
MFDCFLWRLNADDAQTVWKLFQRLGLRMWKIKTIAARQLEEVAE